MLPPEVLDRIVDYLYDDNRSLGACALASRAFLPTARYHRFNELRPKFFGRYGHTLISLVADCPDLARSISALSLFAPEDHPTDQMRLLQLLPALSTLYLRDDGISAISSIKPCAQGLRKLDLDLYWLPASRRIVEAISWLPALEELYLSAKLKYPGVDADFDPNVDNYPPPPRLHKVCFRREGFIGAIHKWLMSRDLPVVFAFQEVIEDYDDSIGFMRRVEPFSYAIQELAITFRASGGTRRALSRLTLRN